MVTLVIWTYSIHFYKHMCFHFERPGTDEAIHLKAGDQGEMVVILVEQEETQYLRSTDTISF